MKNRPNALQAGSTAVLLIFCMLVPFVAAGDPPHVVIIHGEPEYGSAQTMPALARDLESHLGVRTTVLRSNRNERGDLPSLEVLDEADLLVLFIRFRMASDAQFERLKSWFDAGKPALAFRTTSHGFWEDKGWFVPFFGGHYKAHAPNQPGTSVVVSARQQSHPILRGVATSFHFGHGGTYNTQPLSDFVKPLLFGKTLDLPAEPVAWTAAYRPGQRLFYTSLGDKENFENASFQNLILNASAWGLGREVPKGGVLSLADSKGTDELLQNIPPAPQPSQSEATALLPEGDLEAWQHWDPSVEPRAIGLDDRANTSSGGPVYSQARWTRDQHSVIARPGFGDIMTKQHFKDGLFKIDFLIPEEPSAYPKKFRGNSGVFIDGKWEIQIVNSYGDEGVDDKYTCGAIFGVAAPTENACGKPGTWQSMEVAVQRTVQGTNLSVWLNGVQIHDQISVSRPTVYGFIEEDENDDDDEEESESFPVVIFKSRSSKLANFEKDFTCRVSFRTEDDGPIFGKARPMKDSGRSDLSLVVRKGRLVWSQGKSSIVSSRDRVDDGEWHQALIRSTKGQCTLYVDGKAQSSKNVKVNPTRSGSRLILGYVATDFPANDDGEPQRWQGEIRDFDYFPKALTSRELQRPKRRALNGNIHWEAGGGIETFQGDAARAIDMGASYTAVVRFRGEGNGPLFSKAPLTGRWAPDGKVLFVSEGHMVFDVGWVGAIEAEDVEVDDGKWHVAAVVHHQGATRLYVDGKLAGSSDNLGRPDGSNHVFKVGACSTDFPDDAPPAYPGQISHLAFRAQATPPQEIARINFGNANRGRWNVWREYEGESTPPLDYQVVMLESEAIDEEEEEEEASSGAQNLASEGGPLRLQADSSEVRFANVTVEPLGEIDHASIIRSWDDETLVRGHRVYDAICITCHGNLEKEGSLPTSRKFWEAEFKNGKDPYSLFTTLGTGYEQMPAFPFLTVQQRYDVIHYIRESLVRPTNLKEYFEVTDRYLAGLPKGISTTGTMTEEMLEYAKGPKYLRMDFGPMLDWTYQVGPNNIAYKAIAVRLDSGPGGVSKGRAWQIYDHDTMRVAAAWSGTEFIDWKGIAFDQSHGTHASIVGDIAFTNPVGPGWAHPVTGSWDDPRFLGRDSKPYGPLPREWVQFKGQYLHGQTIVIDYTVGDARVLESPGMERSDANIVYSRTLNVGPSSRDLRVRLAPSSVSAVVGGSSEATVIQDNGFQVLSIPAKATPLNVKVLLGKVEESKLAFQAMVSAPAEDLAQYLHGGPARFPDIVVTEGKNGGNEKPFEIDEITYPDENPWNSWMRIGGFDFMPDGKRAAVATWLGDVWIVDGIDGRLSEHQWKRICTGLFQPLGVKVVDGDIYVTCRDQIALLHDFNGDEEIDYIECFNSDHQVTEHFHEFAMGLQRDDKGNFYYAKSARHAKPALVPHHGTLLKVSPDGAKTEILAVGFRAANGVCLNPDGSFIVTDQEGHWNPKNRINYVRKGGFYGNMMGYHDVVDESDKAMEQPLCWITNAFDRSPGELLWVPQDAGWGALNGQLLNMSYGTGQIFLVPHEIVNGQAQGGMVSLGLEFPTGTMRGRFHRSNGQLYSTGMFAWAGNRHQDGGFYRIRYTGKPAYHITHLRALRTGVELTFSDPLESQSASDRANFAIKTWDLKRTKNYGSRHYNETPLRIESAELSNDRKTLFLSLPQIRPTWSMEIKVNVKGENGAPVKRTIHNTIHHLQDMTLF